MSRPEKPIDWKKVDSLLMAGCLGTEIAEHFDMHADTLYRRIEEKYGIGFTAYCSLKRAQGNSILRAKQFEKALSLDNTMLIWLGKNRLGQSENPAESKITAETINQFNELMKQIKENQSVDFKIEESKSKEE